VDPEFIARWLPWLRRILGTSGALLGVAGVAVLVGMRLHPGPTQPIPFSHRLHAELKGISCLFCHSEVDRSAHPGMPPVEKCLLCHNVIIPEFEPIQVLHQAKREGKGVPWNRVNVVPDFVFFNHQIHVARGFDCGQCHGDIRNMDRVKQEHRFTMGFCVDCHKANQGPTNCQACHR
jgi:hypothetical protein